MLARTLVPSLASAALLMLLAAPAPALAKGGDDVKSDCPRGQVEDKRGRCVDADDKSASTDALYEAGRSLARAGAYTDALNMLRHADQADARVLTYTGFATRKLGDVAGGMRYYAKALRIDPTNTVTRSYLGEAHLMRGERDAAQAELDRIARSRASGRRPMWRWPRPSPPMIGASGTGGAIRLHHGRSY